MARVYGLVGWIGCGKDTAAQYLVDRYGYRQVSFANTLKDAVAAVFGWSRELLEGRTMESRVWREQPDSWWSQRLNIPNLTPRWVLQNVGTEVFRNHFHQDIWIASTERVIQSYLDQGYNVVISDCRFANEVNAIKNVGGMTCRVFRGENPVWYEAAVDYNKGPNGNSGWALGKAKLDRYKVHASEYSSIGLEYDFVIQNDFTINDLHNQVNQFLNLRVSS